MGQHKEIYSFFTYVLYPLEDISHERLLKFIKSHYRYAFIEHPHEYEDDPKSHIHIVFQLDGRHTINGVNKFFQTDYVKPVENLQSAMMYLVHQTYSCVCQFEDGNREKRPFPASNIDTNIPKWLSLIEYKSNFAQLEEVMHDVDKGLSIWESIENQPYSERAKLLEYMTTHSAFIQLANNHINIIDKRNKTT